MNKQRAIDIARSCLLYLLKNDQQLEQFCSTTGIDYYAIEDGLDNSIFLECALEYCLSTDALIIEITKSSGFPIEDFVVSFAVLSGRDIGE